MENKMTIRQMINRGTFDPNKGQYLNWIYYDRQVLDNAGNLTTHLFHEGLGGDKTLSDTNYGGGDFPSNEKQEIWALEFWFYNQAAWTHATYQNFLDYLATTTMQFTIKTKSPQLQLPLYRAFGLSVPNMITGGQVGDQVLAHDAFMAVYELPIEIILQAQTPWNIDLIQDEASAAGLDDMKMYVGTCGPLTTT